MPTTMTFRQRVVAIPSTPHNDALIAAACENAEELGLDESTDEEAFYAEVFGQVIDLLAPEMGR